MGRVHTPSCLHVSSSTYKKIFISYDTQHHLKPNLILFWPTLVIKHTSEDKIKPKTKKIPQHKGGEEYGVGGQEAGTKGQVCVCVCYFFYLFMVCSITGNNTTCLIANTMLNISYTDHYIL
jgi:hypothetical protein